MSMGSDRDRRAESLSQRYSGVFGKSLATNAKKIKNKAKRYSCQIDEGDIDTDELADSSLSSSDPHYGSDALNRTLEGHPKRGRPKMCRLSQPIFGHDLTDGVVDVRYLKEADTRTPYNITAEIDIPKIMSTNSFKHTLNWQTN